MPQSSSATSETSHYGLLSCCAAYLRENVSRRSHMIGTVLYPQSFTVRDLRVALQACLSTRHHSPRSNASLTDAIISSLELQDFFYNGSWKDMAIATDDDVCIFLYCDEDKQPPTGVFPALAKCYSPTCEESGPCYSPSCPKKNRPPLEQPQLYSCYSTTCNRTQGCYSPTCPHQYFDPFDDSQAIEFPVHGSPLSSNGPPTPVNGPLVTWMDHCLPFSDRPRRSFSSYLMGFPTDDVFTDFWISAAGI